MGTARHENHTVSPGFSRADGSAPDTAGSAVLYGNHVPISGQADSREYVPYKEKRLFPGLPPTSPGSFASPHWTPRGQSPCPGSGILTRFPFDRYRQQKILSLFLGRHCPRFRTEFSYLLGPTDPCSTAVHMEPFSTSVFKVLV